MKMLIAATLILALTACTSPGQIKPEHRTITEVRYLVRVPPAELITLPEKVEPLDVDSATQADVAGWIIRKEEYTDTLENMIAQIAKFLLDEQAVADAKASEENVESRVRRNSNRNSTGD